jgi:uncharacterized protein YndB with AHSA1/START domain
MSSSPQQITITVEALVNAPVEKVWSMWTEPEHIVHWNYASDDWHTPRAVNDLRIGGSFLSRMEAKDGSFGFDFGGEYDDVQRHKVIAFTLGDGRKVRVTFTAVNNATNVTESFDAERVNDVEMQRSGWQAILTNFKKYVESH